MRYLIWAGLVRIMKSIHHRGREFLASANYESDGDMLLEEALDRLETLETAAREWAEARQAVLAAQGTAATKACPRLAQTEVALQKVAMA